jgi:hypothetical protein
MRLRFYFPHFTLFLHFLFAFWPSSILTALLQFAMQLSAARLANASTFLFSAPYPVFAFSFCLDAKRNKKIKAKPPNLWSGRVFAFPRLPMCSLALSYFSSSCVMGYHNTFIFLLLLLAPFILALNSRFKSAAKLLSFSISLPSSYL